MEGKTQSVQRIILAVECESKDLIDFLIWLFT